MSVENAIAEKRFGVKIVTAWFESAINPIIEGLSIEQERLSRKSWTWQFMPGRLESIRYIGQMVPVGFGANLDQFAKYHQDIGETMRIHDEQARDLFVACKNLERAILDSGELDKIFTRVTTDEALRDLGKSLNDMFVGAGPSERLGWIAQEVINRTDKLPTYVNHAPLWNRYRDDFMAVLNQPSLKEAGASADRACEKLLQTVNRLIESLSSTREQLSLEYDVPPVPTASMLIAPEYDFANMQPDLERTRRFRAMARARMIQLDADLVALFPDSLAINAALRELLARQQSESAGVYGQGYEQGD